MKSEKILPFTSKPLSIMYHYTAFPLAILQANMPEEILDKFISTKYVNCIFETKSLKNKFNIGNDLWFTEERILLRHSNVFSDIILKYYDIDIVKFLKDMMDKGLYPQGNYNEEWIPGKFAYQKYHFYHDYLLIGYNDEKQVFYSVGFLKDDRFQKFEIPYINMKKAVETLFDTYIGIDLLEYNARRVANVPITFHNMLSELIDYLNSINKTSNKIVNSETYYGLAAILELCNYIKREACQHQNIEIKYMRGFMEHKFFMNKRINYLFEQGYIKNSLSINYSEEVYKISEKVHLLAIKYLMTHQNNIIDSIVESIKQTIKIEKEYLPIIIDELKNGKLKEERI